MRTDPHVVEANYLTILWRSKSSPQSRRLDLLKRLATVVVAREGTDWDYASVRNDPPPIALEEFCFVCGVADRKLYRHHVIQIQHGGSNSPRNVVSLCHGCHQQIHPWLSAPTTHEYRRGWTKVGDMFPWFFRTLERIFGRGPR